MTVSTTTTGLYVKNARLGSRIFASELRVNSGECVVLCGPNGSGKSSLLRLLGGLELRFEGTVSIDGNDVHSLTRRKAAALTAWLPQHTDLTTPISCEAIVTAARYRFLEGPEKAQKEAIAIMQAQGVGHLVGRPAQQVSGGELQRVRIACLIAQDAPYLLVDEPANHLDPHHQVATYQHLGRLWQDEGRAIVLVTHDVRLAQLLGPPEKVRLFGVKNGELGRETSLAASDLQHTLSELYGVPFVGPGEPGSLAIALPQAGERNT